MKKKQYNYYKLDVGFYPDVMKLCFDEKVFQQILKDHNITLKASALDTGCAETHQIGDGKEGIIILIFNLNEVGDTLPEIADTVSHEVSHAIDHLAEFIGEEDGIGGETRAYLTGSLVKQILKIYQHEKDKYARKASRKVPNKKSGGSGRPVVQVDQHNNGSAGSDSLLGQTVLLSGAQDANRSTITKTDPSI